DQILRCVTSVPRNALAFGRDFSNPRTPLYRGEFAECPLLKRRETSKSQPWAVIRTYLKIDCGTCSRAAPGRGRRLPCRVYDAVGHHRSGCDHHAWRRRPVGQQHVERLLTALNSAPTP